MVDAAASAGTALEVVDLGCLRGDHRIFEGLSFTVNPGTILQLAGANGSGKTSLLRILSGLAAPYGGTVRWQGMDIHQHLQEWHRHLCFTGHLAGVAGALTARENLKVAIALGVTAPRITLDEALRSVDLIRHIDTTATRLSAGQRQRLVLARLVLSQAPIWLLDEPLTALDSDGKRLVERLLAAHIRRGGLAVVATHQPLDVGQLTLTNLYLRGNTVQ